MVHNTVIKTESSSIKYINKQGNMSYATKEPDDINTTGIIQIKCSLFPSMPIFVSLHKDLAKSDTNNSPHLIAQRLSKIIHHPTGNVDDSSHLLLSSIYSIGEENHGHDNINDYPNDNIPLGNYFAIADASRILSLDHLSVAIHTALLRTYRRSLLDTDNSNRGRGTALESIVCAAGTTHVASIQTDYAFLPTTKEIGNDDKNRSETDDGAAILYNVLLIGVNVSLDAYRQVLLDDKAIGLASFPPEPFEKVMAYFSRPRTPEEISSLIKAFKTTREEVAMQGLEKAILHRVASKFYT
jgi:hypothetical protein